MSLVRFNISDATRTIHGDVHGSLTDPMIAALTAEPETIEEYKVALARFVEAPDWLDSFERFGNHEPHDEGIIVINLSNRTVSQETSYSIPMKEGSVKSPSAFSGEAEGEDVYIPYKLPDDWEFFDWIPGPGMQHVRTKARQMPFDARPVLFGRPLIEHIVRGVAAGLPCDDNRVTAIHITWLMTPREDLGGKTPREVLFERRDFIDFDLHSRSLQWSFTKVCPPPIAKDSFAYINAGFGTHEWVLYYGLVRHLIDEAANSVNRCVGFEDEIARLQRVRDEWLRTPDPENGNRLPMDVIELERRRINMVATAKEILIDENCPCCVALAADFETPMFIHLDGCSMEDRFEFSACSRRSKNGRPTATSGTTR